MKKTVVFGLLVILLAFGFIGCDSDSKGDDYKLTWGLWIGETYSSVSSNFTSAGASLTPAGTNAGYLTGSIASTAFSVIITTYQFDDGGFKTGSFESLVNFQNDGIGAPQALKAAMLEQKNNVPVGGVFQTTIPGYGNSAIVFYIEKN
jgi:hypothetical protein